jgi:hypothetical protein
VVAGTRSFFLDVGRSIWDPGKNDPDLVVPDQKIVSFAPIKVDNIGYIDQYVRQNE